MLQPICRHKVYTPSLTFLTMFVIASCAPKQNITGLDNGSSNIESINDVIVSPGTEPNTLVVSEGTSYLKKEKLALIVLGTGGVCPMNKGDIIRYEGKLEFGDGHVGITLSENSLPSCPFRKGYIFGQHYMDESGSSNSASGTNSGGSQQGETADGGGTNVGALPLYPMASWVPTCEEAGFGVGAFNAWRDGGMRKHAGCDLYATVGRPVYAIEDGVVKYAQAFYLGTDELVVVGNRTVRYGEVMPGSHQGLGLRVGSQVKKGQMIAKVGKLIGIPQPMLHFELYKGTASGYLTVRSAAGGAHQRRSDLQNPTTELKQWRKARFSK